MYWLCFSGALFTKNNYHLWIFSLISNSECKVIDPNFDLLPISGSGLITCSHYPVLFWFFFGATVCTEMSFCTDGCSFQMVLMCTCTWSALETFQTWKTKVRTAQQDEADDEVLVLVCVTATPLPRKQAVKCRFSLWLQDIQHNSAAHYFFWLPPS